MNYYHSFNWKNQEREDLCFIALVTTDLDQQKWLAQHEEYEIRRNLLYNSNLHLEVFEQLFLEFQSYIYMDQELNYQDKRIMEKIENLKSLI